VQDVDDAVSYTVNGNVKLLEAASTQSSVKRVVFTSSIVAAGYPKGPEFKLDVGKKHQIKFSTSCFVDC
jgi:nucleoside-diphosphate-sugar epimerase